MWRGPLCLAPLKCCLQFWAHKSTMSSNWRGFRRPIRKTKLKDVFHGKGSQEAQCVNSLNPKIKK